MNTKKRIHQGVCVTIRSEIPVRRGAVAAGVEEICDNDDKCKNVSSEKARVVAVVAPPVLHEPIFDIIEMTTCKNVLWKKGVGASLGCLAIFSPMLNIY